jgi:tetratricopeptide (TPR) repeat protein
LRAIELSPSLTGAHYHYAWLMELLQRSDLALPAGERTIELDPLSPFMRANLADQYRNAGRYGRALRLIEEALELQPGFGWALGVKAQVLKEMGDIAGALEVASEAAGDPVFGYRYAMILSAAGREDEVREILAGIDKTPRNVLALVGIYAALGEADEAFHWINIAKESKMVWYPWFITWFRELHDLREDPRMRELAEELGLSEALNRALGWLTA